MAKIMDKSAIMGFMFKIFPIVLIVKYLSNVAANRFTSKNEKNKTLFLITSIHPFNKNIHDRFGFNTA